MNYSKYIGILKSFHYTLLRFQNRAYPVVKRGIHELQKPKTQIAIATTTIVGGSGITWLLRFDNEIEVKNKYVKIEGDRSLYMITTSRGKIYKFDRSTWKMHYAQAELWNSVEKGEKYRIKGFGIRWPFFGMYPNIHSVRKIN